MTRPLRAVIFLSSVAYPATQDNGLGLLGIYLYLLILLRRWERLAAHGAGVAVSYASAADHAARR
jgi:hypothetical protein